MRQAGVTTAREPGRDGRAWFDFDTDDVWQFGPSRRTVVIRGRGAELDPASSASRDRAGERERPRPATRPRRPSRPYERPGYRPDRAAMWAVVLGLLLVLIAATQSSAAVIGARTRDHGALVHVATAAAATWRSPALP